MLGMPTSVQELLDLFHIRGPVAVAIGDEDCFVLNYRAHRPDGFEFSWSMRKKGESARECCFYFICPTRQAANGSLNHLFELPMGNWNGCTSTLSWLGDCDLVLKNCQSQDNGLAFKQAYLLLENENKGPVRLDLSASSVFDDAQLIACLSKLQALSLAHSSPRSWPAEIGRAIVSADLNYLMLAFPELDDEVLQTLLQNIREGRGPKGISLDYDIFGPHDSRTARFLEFCDALSCLYQHQYLKILELKYLTFGNRVPDPEENALLAVWRTDLGLTSFSLTSSSISQVFWDALLEQISLQSSLRQLDFNKTKIRRSTASSAVVSTEQLANTILANEHIEQTEYCGMLDQAVWYRRVVPALQHNEHRERFAAVKVGPTRRAILAQAVKKVRDMPSLLYALLHGNLDIVAESSHGVVAQIYSLSMESYDSSS